MITWGYTMQHLRDHHSPQGEAYEPGEPGSNGEGFEHCSSKASTNGCMNDDLANKHGIWFVEVCVCVFLFL